MRLQRELILYVEMVTNMIFITGDTHGDIDYKKLLALKEKNLSYDDYLIICGDAGICWSPKSFPYMLDLYRDIGCTILFIDGNHENFDMLEQAPLVEYKGALMHHIDDHIFHVLRGEKSINMILIMQCVILRKLITKWISSSRIAVTLRRYLTHLVLEEMYVVTN